MCYDFTVIELFALQFKNKIFKVQEFDFELISPPLMCKSTTQVWVWNVFNRKIDSKKLNVACKLKLF